MKEIKLGVREGYKKLSKYYDTLFNIATISEEEYFYRLVGDVKGKQILDVGVGTGRYAIPLAKKGAHVQGIDFSKEMISTASKKAESELIDLKLELGNIEELPYKKEQFDIVISNLVFDHIKNFEKGVEEIVRVCKLGGSIIISTIHPDFVSEECEEFAPFELEHETLLIRRYKVNIPRLIEILNRCDASIKKMLEIKVSDKIEEMNPDVYKDFKGKTIILMIKAEKS